MLREVINDILAGQRLFRRAVNGEIDIDLGRGVVLNSSGLESEYLTREMMKSIRTSRKHPYMSAIVRLFYIAATDWESNRKQHEYLSRKIK